MSGDIRGFDSSTKFKAPNVKRNTAKMTAAKIDAVSSASPSVESMDFGDVVKNDVLEIKRVYDAKKTSFFESMPDWLKKTLGTGAVIGTSVESGILKLGEGIFDGLNFVNGKIDYGVYSAASGITGLFDKDLSKSLKDTRDKHAKSTAELISRDLVGEANKSFYEGTEFGKAINNASAIKYDSKTAKTITNVTEKGAELAAATGLTVVTGGGAAPLVVGALAGMGQQSEKTFQENGADFNSGTGKILLSGGLKGLDWMANGKLISGAMNLAKDIFSMATEGELVPLVKESVTNLLTSESYQEKAWTAFKGAVRKAISPTVIEETTQKTVFNLNGFMNLANSGMMLGDDIIDIYNSKDGFTAKNIGGLGVKFIGNLSANAFLDIIRDGLSEYEVGKLANSLNTANEKEAERLAKEAAKASGKVVEISDTGKQVEKIAGDAKDALPDKETAKLSEEISDITDSDTQKSKLSDDIPSSSRANWKDFVEPYEYDGHHIEVKFNPESKRVNNLPIEMVVSVDGQTYSLDSGFMSPDGVTEKVSGALKHLDEGVISQHAVRNEDEIGQIVDQLRQKAKLIKGDEFQELKAAQDLAKQNGDKSEISRLGKEMGKRSKKSKVYEKLASDISSANNPQKVTEALKTAILTSDSEQQEFIANLEVNGKKLFEGETSYNKILFHPEKSIDFSKLAQYLPSDKTTFTSEELDNALHQVRNQRLQEQIVSLVKYQNHDLLMSDAANYDGVDLSGIPVLVGVDGNPGADVQVIARHNGDTIEPYHLLRDDGDKAQKAQMRWPTVKASIDERGEYLAQKYFSKNKGNIQSVEQAVAKGGDAKSIIYNYVVEQLTNGKDRIADSNIRNQVIKDAMNSSYITDLLAKLSK